MDGIVQDGSTAPMATAIEANLFAFGALMRRWPRAEVHDDPELLWWITDIPFAVFNCLLRANLASETVDATIEAVIARGRAKHVPLLWWTGPATKPPHLGRALEAHGFASTDDGAGMAVDLRAVQEAVPPAGLIIERVQDEATLQQWSHVLTRGFEMPDEMEDHWRDMFASLGLGAEQPLRHYLGWFNGEPVATSSLLLAAGVAGIYDVATLPDARRQGIGAAMTLAPLLEARRLGYRVGILHASEMGFSVYARLGFREYCKIGQYLWTSDTNSHKP